MTPAEWGLSLHRAEAAGHHTDGLEESAPVPLSPLAAPREARKEWALRLPAERLKLFGPLAVTVALLAAGCAVKHTTKISPAAIAPPAVETSADALAAKLNKERQAIRTLSATVALEPTTGSVYSGVIKEYHDVRAFILVQSPDHIRMAGQAPVVRTSIFDMASDGRQFEVSIPSKQKFLVGSTEAAGSAKNSLENLRPQHILEALLVPAIDPAGEKYFLNQERTGARIYDVLNVIAVKGEELTLKRRVWFDAATLDISRVEFYNGKGAPNEDVRYSADRDYQGVRYPSHIVLERPAEDYSLEITMEKATFNQPITSDKFQLQKPPNAEEVTVGAGSGGEGSGGR